MTDSELGGFYINTEEDLEQKKTLKSDLPKKTKNATKKQESKKRKREEIKIQDEKDQKILKQKAKKYCEGPKEWKDVAKYSKQRLQDFVQTKEFEREKRLYSTVDVFIQDTIGLVADKIGSGSGCIQDQIKNDITLHDAISEETSNVIGYINNKAKIALCIIKDVVEGKKIQDIQKPKLILNNIKLNSNGGEKNKKNEDNKTTTIKIPENVK